MINIKVLNKRFNPIGQRDCRAKAPLLCALARNDNNPWSSLREESNSQNWFCRSNLTQYQITIGWSLKHKELDCRTKAPLPYTLARNDDQSKPLSRTIKLTSQDHITTSSLREEGHSQNGHRRSNLTQYQITTDGKLKHKELDCRAKAPLLYTLARNDDHSKPLSRTIKLTSQDHITTSSLREEGHSQNGHRRSNLTQYQITTDGKLKHKKLDCRAKAPLLYTLARNDDQSKRHGKVVIAN